MTTLLGLDLAGRTVLVVGGGAVAARRSRAMSDDGAHVLVVAPALGAELDAILASGPGSAGRIDWVPRQVRDSDLDGAWLVLAATDDPAVNRAVAEAAEQRRIWCVQAGAAAEGTARTPATARSGDVLLGVMSDGAAVDPGRSRAVRDALAEQLGALDLRRRRRPAQQPGRVVLVGGGPGAVDLLTVRGRRALAAADVVVADRLGPTDVLAELAPDVVVVDVGKRPGHHPVPQQEINAILVEQARRGAVVVRLKGGDPYVFGRGGEEVAACRAAGIPVEVVPGVSSALSVPALADIPLTHRGTVTAFHVISGHDGLDDAALACVRDRAATLVILMGVTQLSHLTDQALAAGADPRLPAAIVERGSTPRQRVTRAPLADLARRADELDVRAPAIVVIGDVAAERLLDPDPVP